MNKPRLIHPSYFVWLIALALLWGAWHVAGTPYFIWARTWLDQGQGYDPYAERYYTRCHYLKLSDVNQSHTHYPNNGQCAWIFFPQWHEHPWRQ